MIEPIFGLAKTAGAFDARSLASSYGSWTGVRSNHVIGLDGSFKGSDGSSRSISTEDDRQLLLAIRSQADLIVVDASTARIERYRNPSRGARLAVFSLSGNFQDIPAVEDANRESFLFSGELSGAYPHGCIHVAIPDKSLPFDGFMDWASGQGFKSILIEAGPVLTGHAFRSDVVQESAITRTPLAASSDPKELKNPFDKHANLLSLAVSGDASFSLWRH